VKQITDEKVGIPREGERKRLGRRRRVVVGGKEANEEEGKIELELLRLTTNLSTPLRFRKAS